MAVTCCLYACTLRGQEVPEHLRTGHGPLDERLAGLVPVAAHTIGVEEAAHLPDALFLDAREPAEYLVSHLPGAQLLGYDTPNYAILENVAADRPLVVYCTVGYRSDKMVKRLRKRGYTRVYNLYGSLYAWKLAGRPLKDKNGRSTQRLHTYNRKWGQLVPDAIGEKVY